MKKRLISVFSLLLALAVLVTGCGAFGGGGGATGEQVLRLNNSSEPGALHPQLAQGTHDSWVLEHVFEGLTKKDPEGKVTEGMAESWKVSDDGLVYTLTLRDGINWSNGDPVTAEDFEYAWKFCLDPRNASEYSYQLYYLKGGEELNSYEITSEEEATEEIQNREAEELQKLIDEVGVKVIDEKTLEVTLANPAPYFLELLSFYTYYPINKKVASENPDWHKEASTYVSNGPFKLTEWKHKESIKIEKNEDYYDKDEIKLKEINFAMLEDETSAWQMYESGDLDLAYPLPQDITAKLKGEENPELVIGSDLAVYFYRFNNTRRPFNNLKVRKALAMAIDRTNVVENVAQGGQQPAYGLVPPGIPDVNGDFQENSGDYFKEDLEEAKKLLAEGLQEEGMSSLSLTVIYNTMESHKRIAEAIQEDWRKNLGIDVKLENMEFQVKIDREDALDYDVSRAGWIGDYIDPMTFLDLFASWSSQNETGWTNEEFDKYIRQALTSMDEEERMKAMHEAERIFMEDVPIAPIYFYTMPYAQKPYLKGVYKPANRYPQFHYAYIENAE